MKSNFAAQYILRATVCLLALVVFSISAQAANGLSAQRAKFEPEKGCYIGAFIERDSIVGGDHGDYTQFEALTQKKHASYITYVGYGRPFPKAWAERVKAVGASPHLAFEPNDGLQMVQDDEYLRAWARDAARLKAPIFLRWASEMNGPWQKYFGDPDLYIEKFRLVARVMREEAPNVAMIWTPFAEPQKYIDRYYPGDESVDWVGVNIYSVYVNDGNPNRIAYDKDPVSFLRYVYETYSDRKPIQVSEYAATLYCKGTAQATVDFAIEKMTRFYTALRDEFPRVKSVQWFSLNSITAGLANNNYSFLEDGRTLFTYRQLVADPHFLSTIEYDPNNFGAPTGGSTTLGADAVVLKPDTLRPDGEPLIDQLLMGSGAVAATITEPMLRGLKPGEVVDGDLELRAQLPLDLRVQGMLWQVDGATVALTNSPPFRVSIPRARFGPGQHTARVVVIDRRSGEQLASPEVAFEVKE